MAFIELIDRFVGEFNDLVKYFKQRSKTKYYGDRFEEWVVLHSNIQPIYSKSKGFWELLEWRGDKSINEYAPISNAYPDLFLRCLQGGKTPYAKNEIIGIECKWRSLDKLNNSNPFFIKKSKIIKYEQALRIQKTTRLFYVWGFGWENDQPKFIYVIPNTALYLYNEETDEIIFQNVNYEDYKVEEVNPLVYYKK